MDAKSTFYLGPRTTPLLYLHHHLLIATRHLPSSLMIARLLSQLNVLRASAIASECAESGATVRKKPGKFFLFDRLNAVALALI